MKSARSLFLAGSVAALLFGCGSTPGGTLPGDPGGAKALVGRPSGSPADNSRCLVCHINYDEEDLAVTHAEAGVGCETCHGLSDPHSSDEANITPPDILYPSGKVNGFCLSCHSREDLVKGGVHGEVLAGKEAEKGLCTDCHGEHRLARRSVRWDKETRKLLGVE